MKDLIGNELAVGDRVAVYLPHPHVVGFIAEVKETALVASLNPRQGAGTQREPGHVLVSVVLALPVDLDANAVAQVVKVVDPLKAVGASGGPQAPDTPNLAN